MSLIGINFFTVYCFKGCKLSSNSVLRVENSQKCCNLTFEKTKGDPSTWSWEGKEPLRSLVSLTCETRRKVQ
jgi:hypothetical protein